MKKKRRILSTFLAACMVTTCMVVMTVTAYAAGKNAKITSSGGGGVGTVASSATLPVEYTVAQLMPFMSGATVNSASIASGNNVTYDTNTKKVTINDVGTFTMNVNYGNNWTLDLSVNVEEIVGVTGVTLNPTSATLTVGGTETLTATVEPDTATDKTVTWSSSDETVATVDSNGKVTAVAAGTANITATSNADNTKSATCAVTVSAATPSTYTITIPSSLTVANSGWNSIGDISATGELASGKKLKVEATSGGEFALVNTTDSTNKISYTLNNANGNAAGDAATSWEFGSLSSTPSTKAIGIVVDDYSTKPAGTYTDTVTFTASVVSAAKKLTLTGQCYTDSGRVTKSLEIEYTDNDTWKDIAERYDEVSLLDNSYGPSEGKVVMFWYNRSQGIRGCELKSNESTYNYKLVSINDKVSAYSSYYLD